jgi:DeoR family fructose operon transcriptional repressor
MNEIKMIPRQRREEILKIINDKKIIDVNYLMRVFRSSRATITRDIKLLVQDGLVRRTYGGIMSADYDSLSESQYSFASSRSEFIGEKRAIARTLFSLLNNDETIVLNPGVTTFEIARLIAASDLNINIITNSLKFFDFFAQDPKQKIILLGGELLYGGHMISGPLSCENMKKFQGDTAILGVHGIDISGGLSYPYSQEAELEAVMLERCKRRIVVSDQVKFGRTCQYKVDFDLSKIDIVVTDNKTEQHYIDELSNLGIKVLIARETEDGE